MSSGDTIINQGGPLGHSAEFSKQVLDSEQLLDSIRLSLQGRVRVWDEKIGVFKEITLKNRAFSSECIGWAMGKFEEALSSNMKLSNYDSTDFRETAISMCNDFCTELWLYWKKFEMNDERYAELCDKYRNFVDQAIRHPLNGGIRSFLRDTTQESTQRLSQNITESQEKRGLLSRLGGG